MNVIDLLSKKTSKYSATLAAIPCSELQNEIDRRKEENYQKKVKEANFKADKIEYLINQIQSELETSNTNNDLVEFITESLIGDGFLYQKYYGERYKYVEERINKVIRNILCSPESSSQLLMILRQNVRKNLINSIHKEC